MLTLLSVANRLIPRACIIQMVPRMQKLSLFIAASVVFAAGYLLGTTDAVTVPELEAAQDNRRMTADALLLYKQTLQELDKLGDTLISEGRLNAATAGDNFFALSVGGIDAIRELEEGRGVDPETFAALYAGRAIPDVSEHLSFDADGRLRYKGNIVRIYSRDRLKTLFRLRDELRNRAASIAD